MDANEWLTYINSGGVILLLILFVRLFLAGEIVTSKLLQTIIRDTVSEVLDEIAKRQAKARLQNERSEKVNRG